ncbi:hypothetical protein BP6252_06817 [Coleophoma cylindrospora]|uniref:N-acetyltransferase domain-containing protein n=1 Tax=Coleophoma cylindrospora TaxID=1849047 RepID=A0A3D8RG28_9HELO|nr:hypothetical protein BP6252_06817 [Coleophoma cylindrospora]
MPLEVHPVSEADLPRIVRSQYAAFHPTDPLHRLIYPSPHPPTEEIYQTTVQRQRKTLSDDNTTWIKVVHRDADTGTETIIAAAKWLIWSPTEPTASEPRWQERVSASWVQDAETGCDNVPRGVGVNDQPYVEWVMHEFYQRRRDHMQGPCALLDLCFTDPAWHRRGAGKLLVQWGTERADALGVKCIVEASHPGKPLYESCGFVLTEDVVLDGGEQSPDWAGYGKPGYLLMERPAVS